MVVVDGNNRRKTCSVCQMQILKMSQHFLTTVDSVLEIFFRERVCMFHMIRTQTEVIYINVLNLLGYIMEAQCVFSDVGT
jgi:hypothetical protein